MLEDINHIKTNEQQQALITNFVTQCSADFVKKWIDCDANERFDEFKQEMIDVFCNVAKMMKLKHVCRETITECIDKIIADNKE